MALCIQSTLRRLVTRRFKEFSTAAEAAPIQEDNFQTFRTVENDPSKHTADHLYRLYTIAPQYQKLIFQHGGLRNEWQKQIKTFAEFCLLVRQPAIEVISYLKQTDYKKPVNKYVIYGDLGSGKSSTLIHLLHYGYISNKLLIHIPWVQHWFRFPKEVANSTTREEFMNLPIDAAAWLVHFKHQNIHLIPQLDLKVTKTYEWSSRESTQQGAPLLELIDLGISRIKYANDIIVALMKEIKAASTAGKCNTLVVIDGYNAFFSDYTRIKNDLKQFVPAKKITLTEAFMNITQYDWSNGAIILSVDKLATKEKRESYLPRYLLGKEGFEHLDPFLPISVENYNNEEFETIVEYYKNRKWIKNITQEGIKELQLLTNGNPFMLMEYCKGI